MDNNSTIREDLEELKGIINSHLNICDPEKTPVICKSISTPEGRAKIEAQITQAVLDGDTVVGAITKIESLYNINSID